MLYTAVGTSFDGRALIEEFENEADALAHFELVKELPTTRYAYVEKARNFHAKRKGFGENIAEWTNEQFHRIPKAEECDISFYTGRRYR